MCIRDSTRIARGLCLYRRYRLNNVVHGRRKYEHKSRCAWLCHSLAASETRQQPTTARARTAPQPDVCVGWIASGRGASSIVLPRTYRGTPQSAEPCSRRAHNAPPYHRVGTHSSTQLDAQQTRTPHGVGQHGVGTHPHPKWMHQHERSVASTMLTNDAVATGRVQTYMLAAAQM